MNVTSDPISDNSAASQSVREPVLNPVNRVSEMLFGLFMALTFVGAVSVAESGRTEVRELLRLLWAATSRGVWSTQ